MARSFAGRTFVLRIDRSAFADGSTLSSDLLFLLESGIKPIVIAPCADDARGFVRTLNRGGNVAVGLSGADAALLPAAGEDVGRVQTGILATLSNAGYIPVIEPTAFGFAGSDVAVEADEAARAIASATTAARALFFHAAGGVTDAASRALVEELTPAEALEHAERADLDPELRRSIRACAHGVRAGVGAAQIVDGRIAHATIVELLTARHIGTQVAGTVWLGAA